MVNSSTPSVPKRRDMGAATGDMRPRSSSRAAAVTPARIMTALGAGLLRGMGGAYGGDAPACTNLVPSLFPPAPGQARTPATDCPPPPRVSRFDADFARWLAPPVATALSAQEGEGHAFLSWHIDPNAAGPQSACICIDSWMGVRVPIQVRLEAGKSVSLRYRSVDEPPCGFANFKIRLQVGDGEPVELGAGSGQDEDGPHFFFASSGNPTPEQWPQRAERLRFDMRIH